MTTLDRKLTTAAPPTPVAEELQRADSPPGGDAGARPAESIGPVLNYFAAPAAAIRYAASRPRGHSRVLELVAEWLRAELPVARALDVGCGTGHSTVALLPYARHITGIDSSSEMLAQAPPHPGIEYRKGYAEALPFRGEHFDLVAVSSAYHWFDHERFLGEAARVLRPRGWLVLYKAGSMGRAVGQPAFDRWRHDTLRARYPKVARNTETLTAAAAEQIGFDELGCETTAFEQRHTLEAYVENLLTHSSVIRVVDGGREPIAAARAWLRAELAPFFSGGQAAFTHEVRIHVLRRKPGASPAEVRCTGSARGAPVETRAP